MPIDRFQKVKPGQRQLSAKGYNDRTDAVMRKDNMALGTGIASIQNRAFTAYAVSPHANQEQLKPVRLLTDLLPKLDTDNTESSSSTSSSSSPKASEFNAVVQFWDEANKLWVDTPERITVYDPWEFHGPTWPTGNIQTQGMVYDREAIHMVWYHRQSGQWVLSLPSTIRTAKTVVDTTGEYPSTGPVYPIVFTDTDYALSSGNQTLTSNPKTTLINSYVYNLVDTHLLEGTEIWCFWQQGKWYTAFGENENCCQRCITLPSSLDNFGIGLVIDSASGTVTTVSEGSSPFQASLFDLVSRVLLDTQSGGGSNFPATSVTIGVDGQLYFGIGGASGAVVFMGGPADFGTNLVTKATGTSGINYVVSVPSGPVQALSGDSPAKLRSITQTWTSSGTFYNALGDSTLTADVRPFAGNGIVVWTEVVGGVVKLRKLTVATGVITDLSITLIDDIDGMACPTSMTEAYMVGKLSGTPKLVRVNLSGAMSEVSSATVDSTTSFQTLSLDLTNGIVLVAWSGVPAGQVEVRKYGSTSPHASLGAIVTMNAGGLGTAPVRDAIPNAIGGITAVGCNNSTGDGRSFKIKLNTGSTDPTVLAGDSPNFVAGTTFLGYDGSNTYWHQASTAGDIRGVRFSDWTEVVGFDHSDNIISFSGFTDATNAKLYYVAEDAGTDKLFVVGLPGGGLLGKDALPQDGAQWAVNSVSDSSVYYGDATSNPDRIWKLTYALTLSSTLTFPAGLNIGRSLTAYSPTVGYAGFDTGQVARYNPTGLTLTNYITPFSNPVKALIVPTTGASEGKPLAIEYVNGATQIKQFSADLATTNYSVTLTDPETGANLTNVQAIAIDSTGTYYFAVTGNSPYQLITGDVASGEVLSVKTGATGDNDARGVAFDSVNGYVWVITYTTPTMLCRYELCCLLATGGRVLGSEFDRIVVDGAGDVVTASGNVVYV